MEIFHRDWFDLPYYFEDYRRLQSFTSKLRLRISAHRHIYTPLRESNQATCFEKNQFLGAICRRL